MSKQYKPPEHLKHMGARYEYTFRPESAVELRHSVGYVNHNYEVASVAFPVSGDNLHLMRAGEPRWPRPVNKKKEPKE